jgi:Ribosomal prokaryotic L21 protein
MVMLSSLIRRGHLAGAWQPLTRVQPLSTAPSSILSKPINPSTSSTTTTTVPKLSIVRHPYHLPSAAVLSNDTKSNKFAVVEYSGTQYKVAIDDVIVSDHLDGIDIGQTLSLEKVGYM